MRSKKTKIVLDSDVIIHFDKGECFLTLLEIFPEYQYIILDVVYEELHKNTRTKQIIDRAQVWLKKVTIEKFSPLGESRREYALLKETMGKGESACMVYCKDNNDVLGSSNLRDIKAFCNQHNITYLTTLDFLYHAFIRAKMTRKECNDFIAKVKDKGSKLPESVTDIETYVCDVML